jgi:hypothetical protein
LDLDVLLNPIEISGAEFESDKEYWEWSRGQRTTRRLFNEFPTLQRLIELSAAEQGAALDQANAPDDDGDGGEKGGGHHGSPGCRSDNAFLHAGLMPGPENRATHRQTPRFSPLTPIVDRFFVQQKSAPKHEDTDRNTEQQGHQGLLDQG